LTVRCGAVGGGLSWEDGEVVGGEVDGDEVVGGEVEGASGDGAVVAGLLGVVELARPGVELAT
jgi:hypothetical protein